VCAAFTRFAVLSCLLQGLGYAPSEWSLDGASVPRCLLLTMAGSAQVRGVVGCLSAYSACLTCSISQQPSLIPEPRTQRQQPQSISESGSSGAGDRTLGDPEGERAAENDSCRRRANGGRSEGAAPGERSEERPRRGSGAPHRDRRKGARRWLPRQPKVAPKQARHRREPTGQSKSRQRQREKARQHKGAGGQDARGNGATTPRA